MQWEVRHLKSTFLFFSCFDKMDMHGELMKEYYIYGTQNSVRYNFVTATNCVLSKSVKQWDDHSLHHNYLFCLVWT